MFLCFYPPPLPAGAQPAAVLDEEEELSRALVSALSAIGAPTPAPAAATATGAAPGSADGAAAAAGLPDQAAAAAGAGAAGAAPPAAAPASSGPGSAQLVEGAVMILRRMPASVFSMADLMHTLATKDDAKDRKEVLTALIDKLR